MKTEIRIWSRIGHTPITKRPGAYCDELVFADFDCETPTEAKHLVQQLIRDVPGADYGHFNMPEYWNHNTRSGWTHG
jgi:hypothetical protein